MSTSFYRVYTKLGLASDISWKYMKTSVETVEIVTSDTVIPVLPCVLKMLEPNYSPESPVLCRKVLNWMLY